MINNSLMLHPLASKATCGGGAVLTHDKLEKILVTSLFLSQTLVHIDLGNMSVCD